MLRFLLLLVLINTSCRKLVQDEFPDTKKSLVVNSVLVADKILRLNLSYTAKIIDTSFEYVENAQVKLFKNGVFIENLVYTENGFYTSSEILEENNNYSCIISVPNFETIYCEEFIPPKKTIFNIKHNNVAGVNDDGIIYPSISFAFENFINEKRYYEVLIKTIHNESYGFASLEKIIDPVLISEGLPILVFSNEHINTNFYEIIINYNTGSTSSSGNSGVQMNLYPVVLEFRSISYNYYKFLKNFYLYQQGRYPDGIMSSQTMVNMHSNIEGAYGIFAGFSRFETDTIFP
jgi:hypothetical protein